MWVTEIWVTEFDMGFNIEVGTSRPSELIAKMSKGVRINGVSCGTDS